MTLFFVFLTGLFCGIFFCHCILKKTFKKIPYPLAVRFETWIYASPSFPETEIPEGYELLESTHFLFLQEKHQNDQSGEQQDLKNRAHMLEELVDNIPIALWYRNTRGRIVYCNKIYADVLGTTAQKIITESIELSPALIKQALKTRQSQIARRHIILSGERRYVEIGELQMNQGLVGYAMDLTEMDEKVNDCIKQLYAHEDVLNHLSSPIAIYGSDTRLALYNQAYIKQFDFIETWLRTKPTLSEVLDYLREKRKLPEFNDFREHKQGRLKLFKDIFQPIHELMHQPDGRTLRVVIMPYPLGGIVYIFEDVTEKLALERGYNTLIAVQKTTLDHLYEGILVLGTDYRVRLCNQAFEKLWNKKNLIDKHFKDLLLDTVPLLDLMDKRRHAEGYYTLEKNKHIRYTYVPLPDGAHLFSFVDISDRFNEEQALEERNQMLERVDRLKSNFISHVSQELKTPLKTIKSLLGQLNDLQKSQEIERPVDQLINVINAMLDLAHIEAGQLSLKYEKIEIRSFLSGVVDLVRVQLNEHELEFFLDIHTQHSEILIDPRRIRHALFHLLRNAIHFTPRGGRVTLRVKDLLSNRIEIAVKDTGVGISYGDQERVFAPFEHHDVQGGVGLGLPLVKNLIELHGGEILLSSTPGKGTCVRCILKLT